MKIGILSEGIDDSAVLIELFKKISSEEISIEFANKLVFLAPLHAHGNILPKMELASTVFFDGREKADVVIFGVDLDGNTGRKRKVSAFIKKEQEKESNRYIIPLFLEPHLERIFFEDGDIALKKVLNKISPEIPIPFNDLKPKSRLAKLIKEFTPEDIMLTRTEIYKQLTANLNLDQISKVRASVINIKNFRYKVISMIKK